jgi:hypothetical protein
VQRLPKTLEVLSALLLVHAPTGSNRLATLNPHILTIPSESPAEPELAPCWTAIPHHSEALQTQTVRLADDQMSDEHLGLVWGGDAKSCAIIPASGWYQ